MVHKIQADYARLQAISAVFVREATHTSQLMDQVRKLVESLQNGDWTGFGAQTFYKEMDGLVAPAMKRLITSLRDASGATKQILQALEQAEDEAGALFRGGDGAVLSGEGASGEPAIVASPRPGVPDYAPTSGMNNAGQGLSNDFFDDRRRPYTISAPTLVNNHPYFSARTSAQRYQVTIDGKTIDVYYPVRASTWSNTPQQVAKALAALPKASRDLIRYVNIEPTANPRNAYFAEVFNMPGFEAHMDADAGGIISIYPTKTVNPRDQSYLEATLIHESGHILSQRMWGHDRNSQGWQRWAAIGARDGQQVSVYGSSNVEEDFSESLAQYMIYKGTRYEAQARQLWGSRFSALDFILKNQQGMLADGVL